ncbi:MAG TPA: tetraacyldisaccharide 4'-kinase, partial [Vicinamibacteria bacterium]|nr:tetraacyldisaccharide 4'-kinase [Vicinamibacteria bacterium]
VAGIARPERFAADVGPRVERVAGTAWFRDHHAFSAAEVERCAARAAAAGADALVITAKDAVRFPADAARLPVLVLRIAPEIEDEGALRERLLQAVARRRAPGEAAHG